MHTEQGLKITRHTVTSKSGNIKKVWSVTINAKNDCVVMTEFEAMQIKLKFEGVCDFEMYDMTERHGMRPEHLHKLERHNQYSNCIWTGKKPEYKKGVGPGIFGGAAHMIWEYEDLLEM